MPPRLNKRQQREQEELATLGRPTDAIDESSEEEVAPKPVGPGAGFAAVRASGCPFLSQKNSSATEVIHAG